MRLFGRNRDGEQRSPAEVAAGLRQQILRLTPDQLGDPALADEPVLALLMETGHPGAVATLVAVADGTVSLYFSNGGGYIGAGTNAAVAEAGRRLLETAQGFLPELSGVTDPPLPGKGMTQFVAVTRDGLRAAAAVEKDLGERRHALSPLFFAGHGVITQIRLAQPA